jgi:hypothetical protein
VLLQVFRAPLPNRRNTEERHSADVIANYENYFVPENAYLVIIEIKIQRGKAYC